MKLILDVDPQDYGYAVGIALQTMREVPNQKLNEIVWYNKDGAIYEVIRNKESYTVDRKGE